MNSSYYEIQKSSAGRRATNNQYQKIRLIINIAIIASLAVLFYLGIRPPHIEVSENYVKISGLYGVELRPADIQKLELRESIPEIEARLNGMDLFGLARRGIFKLKDLGRTRLISFSYAGPFICMYTSNEWVVINFNDPAETEDLYHRLEKIVETR
mgnify:CR=1 FL=1